VAFVIARKDGVTYSSETAACLTVASSYQTPVRWVREDPFIVIEYDGGAKVTFPMADLIEIVEG
jgi:hypothetical protein